MKHPDKWTDREIAILLNTYFRILAKPEKRSIEISLTSVNLYKMAKAAGYTVKPNFRSTADVEQQLKNIEAVRSGNYTQNAGDLYRIMMVIRLYQENKPVFDRLVTSEQKKPVELYLKPIPSLINYGVKHKSFGKGIIITHQDNRVTVRYKGSGDIRTYGVPVAFDKELELLEQQVPGNQAQPDTEKTQEPFIACKFPKEFVSRYAAALRSEISVLKTQGGRTYRLTNGQLVDKLYGKENVYVFETESDFNFPDSQPIQICYGKNEYPGTVLSCSEALLIFTTNYYLGKTIDRLEIKAEPWQLLEALCDRMNEMLSFPNGLSNKLITDGPKYVDQRSKPRTGQHTALQMAAEQEITFIWGPPGTGKTQTLAEIALDAISRKERVLMVSYSNVSVDGAIERVYGLYKERHGKNITPGIAVRYGYPKNPDVLNHPTMTTFHLALAKNSALEKERKELQKKQESFKPKSPEYVRCEKRLSEIRSKMKAEEKEIVEKAAFIATTVSKAVIDETLYGQQFDVVMFDEASMSFIPQVVFAASLTSKHFICLGDFCQLPPIVQSDKESILNKDIFQYSGITNAVRKGCGHAWLCLLDTQYRMHPNIADFVSERMYWGLLQSGKDMELERRPITEIKPVPNAALVLADLSGMMSVCSSSEKSYINVLSALLCAAMAAYAAKFHEAGIITPYNAQARLLRAIIRDLKEDLPHAVTCATVHQFQGSEKDVIIFDAVDCYRRPYIGQLLASNVNDSANKLFNVAMTRARGKFIAVGNRDFFIEKKLSTKLLFRNLLDILPSVGAKIHGNKLLNAINQSKMIYASPERTERIEPFFAELAAAKTSVYMDIPGNFDHDYAARLLEILLELQNKGIALYLRANHPDRLPPEFKNICQTDEWIHDPLTIIDMRITWYGMPPSRDHFIVKSDDNIADNMDVLLTQYRPVVRVEGKNTANALYGVLDMTKAKKFTGKIPVVLQDNKQDAVVKVNKPEKKSQKRDLTETLSIPKTNPLQVPQQSKSPEPITEVSVEPVTQKKEADKSEATTFKPSFAAYVSSRNRCSVCGTPMELYKEDDQFFVRCPSCMRKSRVKRDMVEFYLMSGDVKGVLCPICHSKLRVKIDSKGLHVLCIKNGSKHKFSLDEI